MTHKKLTPRKPIADLKDFECCIAAIKVILPLGSVTLDSSDLATSSSDHSYHTPRLPHAVVSCTSEDQIAHVLEQCNLYEIPIIPFTAGTSLEGHTIPSRIGGIVLDMSNMNSIIALHKEDLDCVVQPGLGWMKLNKILEKEGLFFPPDAGGAACIGGMCGTSCSGTFAWRYGTMKENVIGLRAVLPDGTIIKTRQRAHKSSAGYDLTRLFIGSEGTLGIITEITLKLKKIPQETKIARVQFGQLSQATDFVQSIVALGGLNIQRLELMDDLTVKSVNIAYQLKLPEMTTLLIEFAGSLISISETLNKTEELAKQFNCHSFIVSNDHKEAEELWSLRKRAFFASKHLHPHPDSVSILTTDVAVPPSRLTEIINLTKQDLIANELTGSIVAHAGDGNFHVFLLTDKYQKNQQEISKIEAFRDTMARRAIQMEGTITGEHGIGKGKMKLLVEELGVDTVEVMKRIKLSLDANGIMNPGKIFWTKKWLEKMEKSDLSKL